MNNFEKWKQDLTLESLVKSGSPYFPCADCPAEDYCMAREAPSPGCKDIFLEWAKQEART